MHKGQQHILLLGGRHSAHHLAEHPDQHVHDRQSRHEDKDEKEGGVDERASPHLIAHKREVVQERPGDQQREHRIRDAGKVDVSCVGVRGQLPEQDPKDVQHDDLQAEGEEDRSHGSNHALDEDHQLGHRAKHARQTRKAEKAKQTQQGGIAPCAQATTCQQRDHGHHPRLNDHHEDQDRVEDKPRVLQTVPLSSEGHEARRPLEGEKDAEEVFSYLEHRFGS
mmetsp:Transcript_54586/g.119479  ORF Transcript_54586/g.119479 Transcript_54586/m.119479 type:complete len:223 (-) Transcript_54586:515-1183(-)